MVHFYYSCQERLARTNINQGFSQKSWKMERERKKHTYTEKRQTDRQTNVERHNDRLASN